MKYITIIRADGREMTDDCHTIEAEAVAHAERLVERLDPIYNVAVIEARSVTSYQAGSAIYYKAGTGADLY